MFEQIQQWDEAVLLAIQNLHNPVLDFLMPIITTFGNAGMVWISLALILLIPRRTRKFGFIMGAALILAAVLGNLIIKPSVARLRPFYAMPQVEMLIPHPDGFSFPSGHTISSFAAATVLWFCSWKLALPATILAAVIGFSRMYLFCHYTTDVVAGALLGIFCALLMVFLYHITFGRRWPLRRRI